MKQIRKGIDLTIKWRVKLSDKNQSYDNLTLVLTDSRMNHVKINDINITDTNVVTGVFYGKDQRVLGPYMATLWKNWGMKGQSCVDRIMAFELVPVCPPDNKVELHDSVLWTGVQGESAYQSWLNLGNAGTEEDFINDLRAKVTVDDSNKEIIESIIDDYTLQKFKDVEQDILKLQENIDGIENYDDSEIKSQINDLTTKVTELENKPDNDTVYDDTEIKEQIRGDEYAIETALINQLKYTAYWGSGTYFVQTHANDKKTAAITRLIKNAEENNNSNKTISKMCCIKQSNFSLFNCVLVPCLFPKQISKIEITNLKKIYSIEECVLNTVYTNKKGLTLTEILFPETLSYDGTEQIWIYNIITAFHDAPYNIPYIVAYKEIEEHSNAVYDDSEIKSQITDLTDKVTENSDLINQLLERINFLENLHTNEVTIPDEQY